MVGSPPRQGGHEDLLDSEDIDPTPQGRGPAHQRLHQVRVENLCGGGACHISTDKLPCTLLKEACRACQPRSRSCGALGLQPAASNDAMLLTFSSAVHALFHPSLGIGGQVGTGPRASAGVDTQQADSNTTSSTIVVELGWVPATVATAVVVAVAAEASATPGLTAMATSMAAARAACAFVYAALVRIATQPRDIRC
jgi:hypothetical protein